MQPTQAPAIGSVYNPSPLQPQKEIEEISNSLNKFYYHNKSAVINWYDRLSSIAPHWLELLKDPRSVPSIVYKIYLTLNMDRVRLERNPMGSTGSQWVKDSQTEEILFIRKNVRNAYQYEDLFEGQDHPEDLGIPISDNAQAVIERERLYYELDHGFAGVPFTVLLAWGEHSLQLYEKSIGLLRSIKSQRDIEILKPSLRKCVIHQFRMVNMDPTHSNVLIKEISPNGAIPIDGGYILPYKVDRLACCSLFEIAGRNKTLHGPPFLDEKFSSEEVDYIRKIDLNADVDKLTFALSGEARVLNQIIKIFRVANMILQVAVERSQTDISNGKKENETITLHDVVSIREINRDEKGATLFAYILQANDDHHLLSRIEEIMNEICLIKKTILTRSQFSQDQLKNKIRAIQLLYAEYANLPSV